MKRKLTRALSLFLSLILTFPLLPPAALAAEGADAGPSSGTTVESVVVNPDSLSLTVSGDAQPLSVYVSVTPDTPETRAVVWSTNKPEVAAVSDQGVVTPKGIGNAIITATSAVDSTKFAQCTVTVTEVPVTLVQMNNVGDQLTLDPGTSQRVTVTVGPSIASNKAVSWSNGDPTVATVTKDSDASAIIEAAKDHPGSSLVTVTSEDNIDAKDTLTVIVSGIVFTQEVVKVAPQGTAQLGFTPYGTAEGLTDWTWESSASDIASVDPVTGVISAGVYEGTAQITCTSDDNPLYTATCTVEVARGQSTIRASMSGGSLSFSDLPFNSKCAETNNGQSLSYVTSLSVSPSQGTLYYGYVSEGDTGSGVASSERYYYGGGGNWDLDEILFVPKADFTGEAVINYTGCTTRGSTYSGEVLVTVKQTKELSYSTRGEPIRFHAEDFNQFCQSVNDRPLSYVTFSPPSSKYGTLYYNWYGEENYDSAVTAGTRYYRGSNPSLDNVAFVPAERYDGDLILSFQGWDTAGSSFRGNVRITIADVSETGEADLSYSVSAGRRVYFDEDDFSDACYDATGHQLDYVRFTDLPSASQGELCHIGSSRVSVDTSYYFSGSRRLIEDVSFLADDDFSGAVYIPFTGTDTRGTTFSGTVRITVSGGDGDALIAYSTSAGRRVYFDAGDFSDASYDATGRQLNYVRFTSLPSSSRGTLYCGSTRVSTGSSYYRTGSSRSLEDVNFLPDDDFSGTVTISFKGTDNKGTTFLGTVEISVSGSSSSSSPLSYTVREGQRLYFQTEDFADACYSSTGRQLDYISFTSLPSSSKGTLYYNGSTKVTTGTSYYRSGSRRLIEDVSFLPADGYSGSLSIPFRGYNTNGARFSGSVSITVESGAAPAAVQIAYYSSGEAVAFRASDFSAACAPELSAALSKVRFTAPPTTEGALYLDYASPSRNTPLRAGTDYAVGDLDRISFVPKAGYVGQVRLSYTATDQRGGTYSSVALINVSDPSFSVYFTDMGSTRWAIRAVDFLRRYGVVTGNSGSTYDPGTPMIRGDYILMLSKAFSFPAAGTDSFSDVPRNSHYASAVASALSLGVVTGDTAGTFRPGAPITRQDAGVYLYRYLLREGKISPGTSADLARFSDRGQVSAGAVEAMGALVRAGIFSGDGAGHLGPSETLSRAEMAALLYNVLT